MTQYTYRTLRNKLGCSRVYPRQSTQTRGKRSLGEVCWKGEQYQAQVAVTQGQLDEVYNQQVTQVGGVEQLQQAAAQAGIAPENLQRDLRAQLLAAAIATKVAPGGDQQAQQAAFVAAVKDVASSIDVEVSPAYGVWDAENLQLIEDPDAVSRPEKPASVLPAQ